MYCIHCGREVADDGRFCGYCGTPIPVIGEQTAAEQVQPTPMSQPQQSFTWEEVVGRNAVYYFDEFQKAESGEKAKFNWAAFLFNASFCLYRKCTGLFQKYFLIPLIIILVACLAASIGAAKFSLAAMLLGGVGSAVGSIWAFINAIRIGRRFNAEYYTRCQQIIDSGNGRDCGTSLAAPILYNAALLVLVLLCSFAGVIFGSWGANDLPNMDSWSLSDGDIGNLDHLSPGLNGGIRPGLSDTDTSSDSVVELSSGELGDIELFLNSEEYNGFLQSAYTDVRDILLTPIFYNYMDPSVDYNTMEREYSASVGEVYGGLSYVSSNTLERVIREKTGYELAEMNHLYLDSFTYVPSVDAYCRQVSDTTHMPVSCLFGTKKGDIYTITYDSIFGEGWLYETENGYEEAVTMTVTLRDGSNGWQFVSNVPNGY